MSQPTQRSNRRQVADGILWLVAALLATYLGLALPLPLKVIAPVLGLVAVFLAFRLFRLASHGEHTMLVWLAGTAGLLGALFFGAVAVSQIFFWGPTVTYEQCLAEALTDTALSRCETEYTANLWQD